MAPKLTTIGLLSVLFSAGCTEVEFGPALSMVEFGVTKTVTVVADTYIYSGDPGQSNGASEGAFIGTSDGRDQRAFIYFDVGELAGPDQATVTNVLVRGQIIASPEEATASEFGLHRALEEWSEGGTATAESCRELGGATWSSMNCNTGDFWSTVCGLGETCGAGGYFLTAPSGLAQSGIGPVEIAWSSDDESNAFLVDDVQDWLDRPEENFGWAVRSLSEGENGTARILGTRESGQAVELEITYICNVGALDCDHVGDKQVDLGGSVIEASSTAAPQNPAPSQKETLSSLECLVLREQSGKRFSCLGDWAKSLDWSASASAQ